MSYPYRNPRLQTDIPQPDPDSRLVLNHETGRYLRLGLREFDWLSRLNGQLHERDVAAALGQEASLVQELLRRMAAAKLICFSEEPVTLRPVQHAEGASATPRRIEWAQFGQLRIHLGRPKALLDRLAPFTRPLLSRPLVGAAICASLLGLALALAQSAEFARAAREFQWGAWETAGLVALIFATTVLHELGHAVVCDHFGAPVRSVGVMIYYLQPAAYADVTDSWQLRNRWHRVAISSAGIYVQAVVASAAVVLWTVLRTAGHRGDIVVVFVALNTALLFFNVIPFVKLDGYWILSNALGIPNLRDRAMEWVRVSVRSALTRRAIGSSQLRFNAVLSMPPLDRGLLAGFGITAIVFGVAMWLGGLAFLLRMARWARMPPLAAGITAGAVVALFGAFYLGNLLRARRRARRPPAVPRGASAVSAVVANMIDDARPLRLNPHLSAVENDDGTITFAWSTPDALTLRAPAPLFAALPRLRAGSSTLADLRRSDLWSPQVEQVLQRLWHERHLRYASDWEVPPEDLRYSRQLGWFSMNSQARGREAEVLARLRKASVTILGAGGLGTHVAWNLAACGVGELHLVDGDKVELTNLNRQLFYTPADVGLPKVEVAAARLVEFNPQLRVRTSCRYLESYHDFLEASRNSTFVVRAVDSPQESLVWVNEACVRLGIPYSGAGFFAQGTIVGPTVIPGESSCVACNAAPTPPRFDRGTGGTLAPLVFATAGLLAHEVVTHLGRLGRLQTVGRMLALSAPTLGFTFSDLPRNPECAVCGRQEAQEARASA